MTYQNHVLRQLERHCPEELVGLERVQLEARDVLQTAGAEVTHALFPERGLLSLVCPSGSVAVELACLGYESMAAGGLVFGDSVAISKLTCHMPGFAYRLEAGPLARTMERSGTARNIMLRAERLLQIQMSTTTLALSVGHVDELVARWLTMAQDRCGPSLPVTHASIAASLAVRRSGVTLTVERFARNGWISASRGLVKIVRRDALIEASNGLYGIAELQQMRLRDRSL